MIKVSSCKAQGFDAIRLHNGLIELVLVPELGAKISSLRDLRTAREWLWTSERTAYERQDYGASYVTRADTGGWDECFPTVAACRYPLPPWQGSLLPDHGELWPAAWTTTVEEAPNAVVLHSSTQGAQLPYTFARTIRLAAGSSVLELFYSVTNAGAHELAFIWSSHPLFGLEPGMRLRLPDGARLNVYLAAAGTDLPGGRPLAWPPRVTAHGRAVRLEELPGPEAGLAFKLWSEPLPEGWAELESRQGRLRFEFDPTEVPQVGLWLNAGGWAGDGGTPHYNLALEPCIGAQDSLEDAVATHGQYGRLAPGARREWRLRVRLQP